MRAGIALKGYTATAESDCKAFRVRRGIPAHTGGVRWSEMGANRLGSAHGRHFVKADGCGDGSQRTREAEWRLAPGGRSRPRLVSGRGPADKAGKDRPKAVPGRSQLPSATTIMIESN